MNTTSCFTQRFHQVIRTASIAAIVLATAGAGRAQCLVDNVTNIIWRVDIKAGLATQNYDVNVFPIVSKAKVGTAEFLAFVLGREPAAGEVLALNLDLRAGTTNIYLSVFSTNTRSNSVLISQPTNSLTTALIDCTNMSFAVDAPLPATSATWLGGRLQLTGTGKLGANGFAPVKVKGSLGGFIVDGRPADVGGSTAIVTRATMKIRGTPLRVQPPIVP